MLVFIQLLTITSSRTRYEYGDLRNADSANRTDIVTLRSDDVMVKLLHYLFALRHPNLVGSTRFTVTQAVKRYGGKIYAFAIFIHGFAGYYVYAIK